MKKPVGFVLLLVALWIGWHAKAIGKEDDELQQVHVRQAAEARDREVVIASLRAKATLDDADKARLAVLEKAQQESGAAVAHEESLVDLRHHKWEIAAEYVVAAVMGLVGLGMTFVHGEID